MPDINDLIRLVENGSLLETSIPGVELKSSWSQEVGKEISSLAVDDSLEKKWVVIGISDSGVVLNSDEKWLAQTEHQISNHINQYLSPTWACAVNPFSSGVGTYVVLEITNPGDLTYWNGKVYKRVGTSKFEVLSWEEEVQLAQKLPGSDFSKIKVESDISSSLVLKFAERINSQAELSERIDVKATTANDILSRLQILNLRAADVLFGKIEARTIRYNQDGDIIEQKIYKGLFSILDDNFLDEIQSWTRKSAAAIVGNSSSIEEETPYPKFALRESLANAVAHSNYACDSGGILIEMHPDRLCIKNNALRSSRNFVGKWFSRESYVSNKLLMVTLRAAHITDEAGNGKLKIFRSMLEAGRPEPLVSRSELNQQNDRWTLTLYSVAPDKHILNLIERIKQIFQNPDQWRLATAIAIWRDQTWSEISSKLDPHFGRVAEIIQKNSDSPFFLYDDRVILKRWAAVALKGQISMKFTASDEDSWKHIVSAIARKYNSEGIIEFAEIRSMLGLTATPAENAVLSSLLKKWSEDKAVIKTGKKGYWKFLDQTSVN